MAKIIGGTMSTPVKQVVIANSNGEVEGVIVGKEGYDGFVDYTARAGVEDIKNTIGSDVESLKRGVIEINEATILHDGNGRMEITTEDSPEYASDKPLKFRELVVDGVVYDSFPDMEARDDITALNDSVFEIEKTEPSINLWNPATAYTRVSKNTTDDGTELLTSATIACKSGDTIYIRVKQDDGTVASTTSVQCYRFVDANGNKNEPRCNITYNYTVPETVSGLGEIVGVEVGIRTEWLNTNNKTSYDIMVTLNEQPAKGSAFVEYRAGGEVKHDKVEKNRAELQEQIDALSAHTADVDENVNNLAVDAKDLNNKVNYAIEDTKSKLAEMRLELNNSGITITQDGKGRVVITTGGAKQ